MRKLFSILCLVFGSFNANAQFGENPPGFHPLFDSTGAYVFIKESDKEKFKELKEGESVEIFNDDLKVIGVYILQKNNYVKQLGEKIQ